MKNVIISADGDRIVYSVPNIVADNLTEYCGNSSMLSENNIAAPFVGTPFFSNFHLAPAFSAALLYRDGLVMTDGFHFIGSYGHCSSSMLQQAGKL